MQSAPESNWSSESSRIRVAGRYLLAQEIGAGGMATVHLGRALGAAGFRRTVAVKRLHAHLSKDADFLAMFVDEARLAARVRHPNVVSTIDVAAIDGQLLLVMEYVLGESLSRLLRTFQQRGETIPLPIVSATIIGVLCGLHAAHDALDEHGEPLGLVHRDVSPQNVIVGVDGIARVLDFGIAKAAGRLQSTRDGQLKGKFAYMAPEQMANAPVDRRADVYAASVILWEMLANRQLFRGESDAAIFREAMMSEAPPPTSLVPGLPAVLDGIVMRGLARDPNDRYPTARDMALAIESAVLPATSRCLGEWVEGAAREALDARIRAVAELERLAFDAIDIESPPGGPADADLPTTIYVDPSTQAYDREPLKPVGPAAGPLKELKTTPMATAMLHSGRKPDQRRRPFPARAALIAVGVSAPLVAAAALLSRGSARTATPSATFSASAQTTAIQPAAPSSVALPAPRPPLAPMAATSPAPRSILPQPTEPNPSAVAKAFAARPAEPPPGRSETAQPAGPPVASGPAILHAPTRPAPTPAAAPNVRCNPPWTMDNDGIRHPKLECL
jgi:eukaryotic-like serine/threonine-protein kinase